MISSNGIQDFSKNHQAQLFWLQKDSWGKKYQLESDDGVFAEMQFSWFTHHATAQTAEGWWDLQIKHNFNTYPSVEVLPPAGSPKVICECDNRFKPSFSLAFGNYGSFQWEVTQRLPWEVIMLNMHYQPMISIRKGLPFLIWREFYKSHATVNISSGRVDAVLLSVLIITGYFLFRAWHRDNNPIFYI